MAALLTKAAYAGVIGDIVSDDRTCNDCQSIVTVSVSAVDAHVFTCVHTVDSVTSSMDASGIVYTVKILASGRLTVSANRWANRAAVGVR